MHIPPYSYVLYNSQLQFVQTLDNLLNFRYAVLKKKRRNRRTFLRDALDF